MSWNCSACTYINTATAVRCEMCGANKPVLPTLTNRAPGSTGVAPGGSSSKSRAAAAVTTANKGKKDRPPIRPVPPIKNELLVVVRCRNLAKGTNPQIKIQQQGKTIAKTEPIKKTTDPSFPYISIDVGRINKADRLSFCLINNKGLMGSKKMGETKVSFRSLQNMFPSRDYALYLKDHEGKDIKPAQCFFRRVLRKSEQKEYDLRLNEFRKYRDRYNKKKKREQEEAAKVAQNAAAVVTNNALEDVDVASPTQQPQLPPPQHLLHSSRDDPEKSTKVTASSTAAVGNDTSANKAELKLNGAASENVAAASKNTLLPREMSRPQTPEQQAAGVGERADDHHQHNSNPANQPPQPPGGVPGSDLISSGNMMTTPAKESKKKTKRKKKKKRGSCKKKNAGAKGGGVDFNFDDDGDDGFGGDPFAAAGASTNNPGNPGKINQHAAAGAAPDFGEDPFGEGGGGGGGGERNPPARSATNNDDGLFDGFSEDPFSSHGPAAAAAGLAANPAVAAVAGFDHGNAAFGTDDDPFGVSEASPPTTAGAENKLQEELKKKKKNKSAPPPMPSQPTPLPPLARKQQEKKEEEEEEKKKGPRANKTSATGGPRMPPRMPSKPPPPIATLQPKKKIGNSEKPKVVILEQQQQQQPQGGGQKQGTNNGTTTTPNVERLVSPDRPPLMTDMFQDDDDDDDEEDHVEDQSLFTTNVFQDDKSPPEDWKKQPQEQKGGDDINVNSAHVVAASSSAAATTATTMIDDVKVTNDAACTAATSNLDDPNPVVIKERRKVPTYTIPEVVHATSETSMIARSTSENNHAELKKIENERDEALLRIKRYEKELGGLRLKLASATSLKVAAEAEARTTQEGGGSDENLQRLKKALEESHGAQLSEVKKVAARRERELKATIEELQEAKRESAKSHDLIVTERDTFKESADTACIQVGRLQDQLSRMQDELNTTKAERDKLKDTISLKKGIEGEAIELKSKIVTLEASVERLENQAKIADAAQAKAQAQAAQAQKVAEDAKAAKSEMQSQMSAKIMQASNEARKAAQIAISKAAGKEADARKKAEEKVTMLQIEMETIRSDLAEAQIEINDLQDTRDDALRTVQEELVDSQDAEEAVRADLEHARKEINKLRARLASAHEELEGAHQQINQMISDKKRYQPSPNTTTTTTTTAAAAAGLINSSRPGSADPRISRNTIMMTPAANMRVGTRAAAAVVGGLRSGTPAGSKTMSTNDASGGGGGGGRGEGHNSESIALLKAYRGALYKFCGQGLALAVVLAEIRKIPKLAPGLLPVITVFGQVHQALFKIRLPQYMKAMESSVLSPMFSSSNAIKGAITQFAKMEANFFSSLKKGFFALQNALAQGPEGKATSQSDREEAQCFELMGTKMAKALTAYASALNDFVTDSERFTASMKAIIEKIPGPEDQALQGLIKYHNLLKMQTLPLFQKMLKEIAQAAPRRAQYAFIDHWNGLATSVIRLEVHFFDAVMKNMESILQILQ